MRTDAFLSISFIKRYRKEGQNYPKETVSVV